MNPDLSIWRAFSQVLVFAAIGALLRLLVQSVHHRYWKQAVRVLANVFWAAMATLLLSEWLEAHTRTLLVLATLLGWLGFEASIGLLSRVLEKRTGLGK